MGIEKHMGQKQKYIFVTGGVLSGVGKGITAASIGAVLQAKAVPVSIQKCDPYLNVDAGLLNPREHGECFVTKDGAETDLDLGHYERFLNLELTQKNATLSGRLLQNLIMNERGGQFGGKTIQLVPHLTNAIQEAIHAAATDEGVHIVEIGGTVGDYEGLSYIEAIREFAGKVGRENCLFIHVVYVPFIATSKEFKTKPAQNAIRDLRSFGIMPDCVVVRTENAPPASVAEKISLFGGVPKENVLLMPNADTVYRVPLTVAESGLHAVLTKFTGVTTKPDVSAWKKIVQAQNHPTGKRLVIGLVAKYMNNEDTYLSVVEALKAAAWQEEMPLEVRWINAELASEHDFAAADALLVPGGFGERGVDGKIAAAHYALDHNKPYLGICLGLQVAVIAAARRGGLKKAHSDEFGSADQNVVYIMKDQKGRESTGGTLRLGNYEARLLPNSLAANLYQAKKVMERHRHRYEVNQQFLKDIEEGGLMVSGYSPDGKLVEFVEAPENDFFIATQAHPEFRSRPSHPHPLFTGLIQAAKQASSYRDSLHALTKSK